MDGRTYPLYLTASLRGLYLRRGHGIIFWEKEFKFENTALEWAALRPRHDNVKVSGVIVVGDGGDTGHWLLHQPLGFLNKRIGKKG